MTDDLRNGPRVVANGAGEDASLAPAAAPLPAANKRRLEALLRELLRDDSVRELLCRH
jgi:hypothetical protein